MKIKYNKFVKDLFPYIALFLSSFAVVYFFSLGNGPLSYISDYVFVDDGIFRHIGMEWAKGHVPYVEAFDHKGPFIFFINLVAYLINPIWGIGLLEIVSLFVSLIFGYKILKENGISRIASIILTVIIVFFFAGLGWNFGNTCSEFVLPFISAGAYCFSKYKSNEISKHPPKYAFVYGIAVGVCFMCRCSDAIWICSVALCIAIQLLIKKEWKNMLCNVATFLTGVLCIAFPFVFYFIKNNALYDFLYGTLLHNLEYIKIQTNIVTTGNASWLLLLSTFGKFLPIIFAAIVDGIKNKKWIFLYTIILPFVFLSKTGYYNQYFLILMPVYFIAFSKCVLYFHGIFKYEMIVLLLVATCINITQYMEYVEEYQYAEPICDMVKEIDELYKKTNGNVYFLNIPAGVLWDYDINQKFFNLQNWLGRSPKLANEIVNEFYQIDSEYVLTTLYSANNGGMGPLFLFNNFDEKYKLIETTSHLQLYQKIKVCY